MHHQNQHIDPTMTKYNFSIGASDFYEVCEKVERRIKEVDEKHPPKRVKKDRVTAFSLYIVCPKEISDKGMVTASEYFRKVYGRLEDYFGSENVGGGFVHFDEKHSYIDARTKEQRESLHHMNVFIPAYVDEEVKTKKGATRIVGINGKHASSRRHMQDVNKIMEDICHEYGIEWHTGQGKNRETVETLKAKSAKAERELEEEKIKEISERPAVSIGIKTETIKEKKGLRTEERIVHSLENPREVAELERQVGAVQAENRRLSKQLLEQNEKVKTMEKEIDNLHLLIGDVLSAFYSKTVSLTKSWLRDWAKKIPYLDREMSGYENHKFWKPSQMKGQIKQKEKNDFDTRG